MVACAGDFDRRLFETSSCSMADSASFVLSSSFFAFPFPFAFAEAGAFPLPFDTDLGGGDFTILRVLRLGASAFALSLSSSLSCASNSSSLFLSLLCLSLARSLSSSSIRSRSLCSRSARSASSASLLRSSRALKTPDNPVPARAGVLADSDPAFARRAYGEEGVIALFVGRGEKEGAGVGTLICLIFRGLSLVSASA